MDFYNRALELKDETIQNRRNIHKNAEVGLDTPKTKAFVIEKLKEYGLEPEEGCILLPFSGCFWFR